MVSRNANFAVGGVLVTKKILARCHHRFAIHNHVANQAVTSVAALPHAIDKPLIERVNGNDILPFLQKRREVKHVVVVAKVVGGGWALPHKVTVEIQLVVIVGGNINFCIGKTVFKREAFAEQNMQIAMLTAIEFFSLQLPEKDVARCKDCHLGIADPLSFEFVCHGMALLSLWDYFTGSKTNLPLSAFAFLAPFTVYPRGAMTNPSAFGG